MAGVIHMWASSHHFVYVELGSNSFQNKPVELYLVTYSLWKLDTACSKIVVPSFPFHSMKWDDDYLWLSKLPVTMWPQDETAGAPVTSEYVTRFAKRDNILHFEMRILQRSVFPQHYVQSKPNVGVMEEAMLQQWHGNEVLGLYH